MISSEQPSNRRSYRSSLRDEQAGQTRTRILEAAVELIIDPSPQSFSVERVAKRAGVSARTVYHHFPDREALIRALQQFTDERAQVDQVGFPKTVEDFGPAIHTIFDSFDRYETYIRAQLASQAGQEVRSHLRNERRAAIRAFVGRAAPGASEAQVNLAQALVHFLVNSEGWRSLKDESELTSLEAADAVTWAVTTLLDDLAHGKGPQISEGTAQ
jgi:AcrR family transcriptional regulator